MKLQILYFASLAEALDIKNEVLSIEEKSCSIKGIKQLLSARGREWEAKLFDPSTRCAVNQQLADDQTLIQTDAEIAFFPPVTGG